MSNTTYTWKVVSMSVLPKQGGETDVVVLSTYNVTGTKDETIVSIDGMFQQFTYTGGAFTPYEDLTEEQVIGWIQSALGENGVNSIYACIDGQINSILNPPPTPQPEPLPWS
jgi:hypothetical protein